MLSSVQSIDFLLRFECRRLGTEIASLEKNGRFKQLVLSDSEYSKNFELCKLKFKTIDSLFNNYLSPLFQKLKQYESQARGYLLGSLFPPTDDHKIRIISNVVDELFDWQQQEEQLDEKNKELVKFFRDEDLNNELVDEFETLQADLIKVRSQFSVIRERVTQQVDVQSLHSSVHGVDPQPPLPAPQPSAQRANPNVNAPQPWTIKRVCEKIMGVVVISFMCLVLGFFGILIGGGFCLYQKIKTGHWPRCPIK